ncbi:MAG: spore cortex biosynthesis protein YabQ [Clostridia bacterium]|nr:spore cortex biosynthesis protein YabQ [Clostridia bacterium]
MYIDDISSQLQVFLYSVGFGFILGFLYDIFRIVRVLVIKNNRAIPVQDIAYFLLCSVLTFVFLLVVNNGRFRFNILIALVSGFAVYYLTVGRFTLDLVVISARKLFIVFNTVSRLITVPYRLVLKLFGKTYRKLPENIKNIENSRKKAPKTLENKE